VNATQIKQARTPLRADGLTERQLAVVRLILEHAREHGRWPTVRWLQTGLRCTSPNGVFCHLKALRKKGWLRSGEGHWQRQQIRLAGVRLEPTFDGSAEAERLAAALGEG
jgi:SOS-response transcriptional repressor LexA